MTRAITRYWICSMPSKMSAISEATTSPASAMVLPGPALHSACQVSFAQNLRKTDSPTTGIRPPKGR